MQSRADNCAGSAEDRDEERNPCGRFCKDVRIANNEHDQENADHGYREHGVFNIGECLFHNDAVPLDFVMRV